MVPSSPEELARQINERCAANQPRSGLAPGHSLQWEIRPQWYRDLLIRVAAELLEEWRLK